MGSDIKRYGWKEVRAPHPLPPLPPSHSEMSEKSNVPIEMIVKMTTAGTDHVVWSVPAVVILTTIYTFYQFWLVTIFLTRRWAGLTVQFGQFFVTNIFTLCISSSVSFFNCFKDQSFNRLFHFKCFTDPGLLKIRQLSTPCRRGPASL